MGHTARILEAAGIATVVVMTGAFGFRAEGMKLPRVVITQHIMGRPLGAPGDVERQRAVLEAALGLLNSAEKGGTVLRLPHSYRTAP